MGLFGNSKEKNQKEGRPGVLKPGWIIMRGAINRRTWYRP